jgi:hypothetical protein
VWWYWLDDGDDDIPLQPVQNPHSAFVQRDVGATGRIPKRSSTIVGVECHIHHEFDLWTRSFRSAVEYAVSKMNIRM